MLSFLFDRLVADSTVLSSPGPYSLSLPLLKLRAPGSINQSWHILLAGYQPGSQLQAKFVDFYLSIG
jgi:hypothetical protein